MNSNTDDWRGLDKLRITSTSKSRKAESCRITTGIWNRKRRKLGLPAPGAASHSRFAMSVFIDLTRGKDT